VIAADELELEMQAMRALDPASLPDKAGERQTTVMEDVWLGSLLHRFPPPAPITYVTLLDSTGRKLHVDAWDLRMTRTAMLVHNPNKATQRLLALHAAFGSLHCSFPPRLSCKSLQQAGRLAAHPHRSASLVERDALGAVLGARLGMGHRICTVESDAISSHEISSLKRRRSQTPRLAKGGNGQANAGGASPACCTTDGKGNASCDAVFGSNRWAKQFDQAAVRIEIYGHNCFTPNGRSACDRLAARSRPVCSWRTREVPAMCTRRLDLDPYLREMRQALYSTPDFRTW
jgi:hypothetical protein